MNQEVENPPPDQSQTSKAAPKKGLVLGLGGLLLIALVVAGVLAYQNFQPKPTNAPEEVITPSPIPTEIPTPTVDPLAGWLAFSSGETCYNFKYPQNVTLTERKEENIVHLSLWGPTQKADTEFYDGISLSFSLSLSIGNLSLSEYVDSQIEAAKEHSDILKAKEAITINGINGFTYTNQGLGTFQNIYLQSPDKLCTLEITNATQDPTNQGYQLTVDQILATLTL